jgi:hypothetical protein
VQVSGAPTEDTGTKTPSASTAGAGISLADFSSTTAATSSTSSTTDGAEPVYLRAVKTGAQSVDAVFSEQVTDDSGSNIDSGDISYIDQNGAGAISLSSTTASKGPRVTSSANNDITSSDVGSDQLQISNTIEDDNNDNRLAQNTPVTQTVQFSSAIQLNGPTNNDISTDIGGSADARLKAGSAEQELGLIRIKDVSGDSPLAKRTLLNMPDGVTVDAAASDLFVTTTDGGISSTSASVEDNGNTIRLDHTGSSTSQEVIRLRGVVVNVAPNATASQSGADNSITIDYATSELSADLLKIERPRLLTNGQTTLTAGQTSSQALGNDIDIQTGNNLPNQIGNQTNIVIKANQSNGITRLTLEAALLRVTRYRSRRPNSRFRSPETSRAPIRSDLTLTTEPTR